MHCIMRKPKTIRVQKSRAISRDFRTSTDLWLTHSAKTGDKIFYLGPMPAGRWDSHCPDPGGGVKGGFVWIRLLPAVPGAPSLNMTPPSLASKEEALEVITGLAAERCQVAAK